MPVSPTEKVLGFEEQLSIALKDISPKDIKKQSDLDDEEIVGLSVIYLWAETTKIKTLKTFADDFLALRISRHRMGRREIVSLGYGAAEPERKRLRSLRELFMGIR
jgi:hypothetical protein